jgi:transcriptional regulator with XRE-family HTH domain
VTFREALQREINVQGLTVAQIAKASKVSKGAIYNILNGTTEDERIRPGTRKALALACDRDVIPEGDGVTFVKIGSEVPPAPGPTGGVVGNDLSLSPSIVVSWLPNRPFLSEYHLGPAFDWLHGLEQKSQLNGLSLVDRVYQKRPDFLSIILHNKGSEVVVRADVDLEVEYASLGVQEKFHLSVTEPVQPGHSLEQTVFVCAGASYTAAIQRAKVTTTDGQNFKPVSPELFTFGGGQVD